MKLNKRNLISIILLLGLLLKLPYLTNPVSDWHSWNQVSTMANARYIYQEGISAFLHPKVDIFENFEENSNSAFAELPLLPASISLGYMLTGGESEWAARLIVILYSLIGTLYFYFLVSEETNDTVGLIAVGSYLISPMVWYFHRTIMTDVPMVSFVIAGLYHFRHWIGKRSYKHLLWATFYTAAAALMKAYALYIGIAYLLLILHYWGWKKLFQPGHLILLIGSWTPILGWIYFSASQIAEGNSGRNLTASGELLGPLNIWFESKYWLQLQTSITDFTLLPLGTLAFIGAFVGAKKIKCPPLVIYWLISVFFYFLFVREGNKVHDYYQMPFTAPVVFVAAIGWYNWGSRLFQARSQKFATSLFIVISFVMILNGAKYSHTKAKLDISPVQLGNKLSELNPSHERVVLINTDSLQRNQALFYAKTKGWQVRNIPSIKEIKTYYLQGARWIGVNLTPTEIKNSSRLEKYDQVFRKVWEQISSNRYKKIKILRIYALKP